MTTPSESIDGAPHMLGREDKGERPMVRLKPAERRSLSIWLSIVLGMIFCMVVIGGVTRLTGSGLSMVEWRPLMGALPPLTQVEWDRVFELYQHSPQYQQVNQWMTISDFKWIFFWEYLHRLFGRLIGLAFALPWAYFMLRGVLKGAWRWRATAALILGGSQGLLGWYMVKSGLVDQPQVSHFRLAAHLSLAFFCGQWVWSMLIDLNLERWKPSTALSEDTLEPKTPQTLAARTLAPPLSASLKMQSSFLVVLIIQIVYGAFMAGSRAGILYTTYPTMNGAWVAPTWYDANGHFMMPIWQNLLNHPDSIHFIHRTLALVVLGFGAWLSWRCVRDPSSLIKRIGACFITLLSLQFLLGVLTVTSGMNVAIAASHQGGSFLLLSATIALLQVSWRINQEA